ncbi:MAG TPA: endonuclease/exonuclease/phosphatase family protein [Anaerohalosphaeraceae bacterium]|jgi:endonuclease/exonuclease/phosphatase family metal-dependent hydrolase|nr:endonuclease/exonuclease/phosphatase family protein [Anaerohalosphaeraceae bacterium]HRT52250.1 endonuclease/exonuclease/phosphatase family protein [Anaerohalosphaeraceae bacterium]HRT87373.1 endonuclease/exonuclease/phosphatase family protein [Anaerohalosphaeraceae bacterium]
MALSDHGRAYFIAAAFLLTSAVGLSASQLPTLEELLSPKQLSKPPAPPLELRVMSFNIRVATPLDMFGHSWDQRKDDVIDVIRRYRPDVCGLQEALKHQIDAIMGGLSGYGLIGVGRDDGKTAGEYSCILYRKDRFEVSSGDTFWLSDKPEEPGSKSWGMFTRICTWGRFIDKDTGRAFYLYNTHLDSASSFARERGAALLLERFAARPYDDPVILTGDLNAGENNRVIQYLKGQTLLGDELSPIPLVDTFRVIHPNERQAGTTGGYRGARGHNKIDYILTEPRVEVLDAQIIREHGRSSDHYPITATIVLNG